MQRSPGQNGGDGAEVIYALRNNDTLAKKIASEIENTGQNVRKYYQRRLPSNPAKDYYYIHRDTPDIQSLIVEYGFLDSPNDDVEQLKNNYQDYAEAVVKALANYTNTKYIPPNAGNYYVVKKGDTLWNIAKNNNTTVEKIKSLNNLTSNNLSIGQYLLLKPVESSNKTNNYYTVIKGDTLYQIAKKYNTTVDELKRLNNLTSNTISIGTKLIVPGNTTYYTVEKGDTLYQIARKYNTTVTNLINLNNLKTTNLSIGQQLIVP